jgi:hypothetical protein
VPGTLGYCRPGARTDRPCEKDSHCASAVCLEQEDGTPSRCQ